MADFVDPNELEKPKRKIYTRKNYPEEKRKQNKEWRKRRRERERANSVVTATCTVQLQEANDGAPSNLGSLNRKQSDSSKQCFPSSNAKKTRFSGPVATNVETQSKQTKAYSRGALMLQMARGADALPLVTQPQRGQSDHKQFSRTVKPIATKESKCVLKELSPGHLEYISEHAVGSGSYGQCFRARYRGIEVIVKQMTHQKTPVDQERARKNLVHEAKVIIALGDQPNLPMILGVVTKSLPLCLVTQFHGVKEESVTLHQAANTKMLTLAHCIDIFLKICPALGHVHLKGYLHNDIKANNVVLERTSVSETEYKPVLIDFGKSTQASASQRCYRKQKAPECRGKSYLAPEVLNERLYSAASDIYSLGRMLKAVSSMVGFYQRVRALVKEATDENPALRPSLDHFMQKTAAVKF